MNFYTVYSGSKIQRVLFVSDATLAINVHEGEGFVGGAYSDEDYYIDDGQPAPRPELGLPATHVIEVGQDWNIGAIPVGSTISIDGIAAGEADGEDVTLTFPIAKTYRVYIKPPFPCKPHEIEVNVHEADT